MTRSKNYTLAEFEQILQLAGEEQRGSGVGFSHADLVRAAGELDISETAVKRAEQLLREQQSEAADREEFKRLQHRLLLRIIIPYSAAILVAGTVEGWRGLFDVATTVSILALTTIGGIVFSASSQTDRKFRYWRRSRKIRVHYQGQDTIQLLLRRRFDESKYKSRDELLEFLVSMNLDRTEAEKRIEEFIRLNPTLFLTADREGNGPTHSR